MKSKQQILSELDQAIEQMDMGEIDRQLEQLSSVETSIEPEDVKLFSARILKQSEEKHNMKRTRIPAKIIAVAAIIIAMGLTIYAATTGLNVFTFHSDGLFGIIHTTEQEFDMPLRPFPPEYLENAEFVPMDGVEIPPMTYFEDVAQAQTALGMPIVLPSAMPQLEASNISGMIVTQPGGNSHTAWLDFEDESSGRLMGIVVTHNNITDPGQPFTVGTTTNMDDGSLGSFTTDCGVEFKTITETEQDGQQRTAFIAIASLGQGRYQYAIAFHGFEQAEREAIINSIDFSVYRG